MSTLDDRLRKTIWEIRTDIDYDSDGNKIPETLDGEFVAQIKQAFADDPNWVEYGVMPLAPQVRKQAAEYGLMTSQEWYDAFIQEMHALPEIQHDVQKLWQLIQEAAKRAAGIET